MSKRASILAGVLLSALSARSFGQGWPMRGADVRNRCTSSNVGPRNAAVAWRLSTGFGRSGYVSVDSQGTVVVGVYYPSWMYRGELWSVSRSGELLWVSPLMDSVGRDLRCGAAPIVSADAIYLGWAAYDPAGSVEAVAMLAFRRDGRELWKYEPQIPKENGVHQFPILAHDGTIYQALSTKWTAGGDEHSSLIALNSANGTLMWRWVSPHRDTFYAGPVLGSNGNLYYQSDPSPFEQAWLYCIDATTGTPLWEKYLNPGTHEAPTLDDEDNLYLVGYPYDGWCTKVDADGNELWRYNTGSNVTAASFGYSNGKVYVPCGDPGGVHVLNAVTGQLIRVLEPGRYAKSLVIDASGNVFFWSTEHIVTAYDAHGTKLWEFPIFAGLHGIALGRDGDLILSNNYEIVCLSPVAPIADVNCDGSVNGFDVDPFVLAISDPERFAEAYPACDIEAADTNQDGSIDGHDIERFVTRLTRD